MATIAQINPTPPPESGPAAQERSTQQPVAPPVAQWLTVEAALYGVVLFLGLALRLWNLGATPLSAVEAGQGLTAFQLYRGLPVTAETYSPLLASLNALIFFLLSDSTTTARLASALVGVLLMALPLTMRGVLGQKTALLATALLAFSPTAVFLSRTLNPHSAVAAGALMIAAGFFNWTREGRQGWLYLLVAGLAVLVTAGSLAVSILIIFALIVAAQWRTLRDMAQRGMALSGAVADAGADDLLPAGFPPAIRRAAILFAALLVLFATAAAFNPGGFGVTTGLLIDWLSRFSLAPRPDGGFNGVFLLTLYEPLLVVAGFVGLSFAILSRSTVQQSIAGWFVGALALDLVMAGRPGGSLILALVPLAFLAALALAELWAGLERRGSWANEGIILAAGLVIAGFGYIGLTGWLERPCAADDQFCQLAWLQPAAALGLFVVIVAFFAYLSGAAVALRGAAITGVTIGLISMVSLGWRLNFGPLMNLPYQPLAGAPAATELQSLADTLSSESLIRTGDSQMLDVTVVGSLHPSLAWELRRYANLTQAASVQGLGRPSAIITPATEDSEFNLGDAYLGQDFALDAYWQPAGLPPKEMLKWLIFREAAAPPASNRVILWLRMSGNQG